ncbi:Adenylate cyclase type 10, partial [Irineochytrium annulatum]
MNPLPLIASGARALIREHADASELPAPLAVACNIGVVAIIDISGYTKLTTELMEANGAAGAGHVRELLSPPLNAVLLITLLHSDPDSSKPDEDLARELLSKAMLCNLHLLLAFASKQSDQISQGLVFAATDWNRHVLKIHVGVGTGSLQHVHVGESRPGGRMLSQAKTGELAVSSNGTTFVPILGAYSQNIDVEKGVIVISEHALDAISSMISNLNADLKLITADITPDEGHIDAAPRVDSLSHARILSYVEESIALAVHAYAGTQEVDAAAKPILSMNELNQIRRVTILFVHFPDLDVTDFEDKEALSQYQRIFMVIIKTVRSFGGCLRQFSCDDKAATALIVFGMHGYAHERGEGRVALNAASAILQRLRTVVLGSVSIGLTTGMVFAGVVGVDKRLDGTVLGTCVNLAARIMTHPMSAGRIVCDDETRAQVDHDLDGGGFVFEPCDDITLKGSGKTSLSSFCREQLEINPKNLICAAAGNEVLEGMPYFGYIQILQQLVRCLKLKAVGLDGLNKLGCLAASAGNGSGERSEFDTGRSSVIMGDSCASSRHLSEIKTLVKPRFNAILATPSLVHLDLKPLELSDVEAMLLQELGRNFSEKDPAVKHIAKEVYELSQGNSMASRLMCRTLVSKEGFDISQAATKSKLVEIPRDAGAAVVAQFDKLDPQLRLVLKVAAVGGHYFNLEEVCLVLRQLSGRSYDVGEMAQLIEMHDTFNFVRTLSDDDEEYAFAHNIIHKGILVSLIPTWAESVHLCYANFYEKAVTADDSYTSALIYHLMKVPDPTLQRKKYDLIYSAFEKMAQMGRVVEGFQYHDMLATVRDGITPEPSALVSEHANLVPLYHQLLYVCPRSTSSNKLIRDLPNVMKHFKACLAVLGFTFPSYQTDKLRSTLLYIKWASRFTRLLRITPDKRAELNRRFLKKDFPSAFKGNVGDEMAYATSIFKDVYKALEYPVIGAVQLTSPIDVGLVYLLSAFVTFFNYPKSMIAHASVSARVALWYYLEGHERHSFTIMRLTDTDFPPPEVSQPD